MVEIALHPDFMPLVRNGKKITTVRYGKRDYATGDALFVAGDDKQPITINGCEYKSFGELTEPDAHNDGFSGLEELTSVLLKFYPHAQSDDTVTIVRFTT